MDVERLPIEIKFNPTPVGFAVDVYDGVIGNHVRHVADLTDKAITQGLESLGWMHWLPMTPDAVFEDGDKYLIRKANGYVEVEIYMKFENEFYHAGFDEWTTREQVTHYARITEPK